MNRKIIVLVLGLATATTGWTGPRHHRAAKAGQPAAKEESIGLGTGAAIGALGGPIGVVIGAAFGGWLGDRMHSERSERQAADARYAEAQTQVQSLQAEVAGGDRDLAAARSDLAAERSAHRRDVEQALSLEVLFRTEQSALDEGTEQRLTQLATLVAPMAGTVVRIEGHTDARGTTDYNEQLSALRAVNVRDVLMRAGLPADRIVVNAAGESRASAPEQDVDGMAMERRVDITLVDVDSDANRVASRTEP
jgi:outer membrane protein OmpA-like peptidoglycan-associated protein